MGCKEMALTKLEDEARRFNRNIMGCKVINFVLYLCHFADLIGT